MRVTPPDLELWLSGYVRAQALTAGHSVTVDVREPATLSLPLVKPLIVVRDDSGSRLDWTTFDRSVGVSVLGGSKANPKTINDLARWVASVVFDEALPMVAGSPIASVEWGGCNGPYAVTDPLDVARRYMTAQYTVTGSW